MTPAKATVARNLFRSEWGKNPPGPDEGVVAKLFADETDTRKVIWCLHCLDLCLGYNCLGRAWAPSPTLASMLDAASRAYYANQ